jgi:hypothetical protein
MYLYLVFDYVHKRMYRVNPCNLSTLMRLTLITTHAQLTLYSAT